MRERVSLAHQRAWEARERVSPVHQRAWEARERVLLAHQRAWEARERVSLGHQRACEVRERVSLAHRRVWEMRERVSPVHRRGWQMGLPETLARRLVSSDRLPASSPWIPREMLCPWSRAVPRSTKTPSRRASGVRPPISPMRRRRTTTRVPVSREGTRLPHPDPTPTRSGPFRRRRRRRSRQRPRQRQRPRRLSGRAARPSVRLGHATQEA